MTRRDAYAEGTYKDTGCCYRPKCLECDLPICAQEAPRKNAARVSSVARAPTVGTESGSATEVALRHGLSTRQVYRLRQVARSLGLRRPPVECASEGCGEMFEERVGTGPAWKYCASHRTESGWQRQARRDRA